MSDNFGIATTARDKEYLGDAVYAAFDGYHIWLWTGDGNEQSIALEPAVLDALFSYVENIKNKYARKTEGRP